MDAPIASVTMQPAPRPIEFDRVQPAPSSQSTGAQSSGAGSDRQPFPNEMMAARLDAQRSVSLDPDTGSLIYRMIDVSSGDVRSQTPSDARLQLRAYIDTVFSTTPEPAIEVTA